MIENLSTLIKKENSLFQRQCIPIIIAFIAGMLVHFTLYSNGLMTPDGIWHEAASFSGTWEVSLGRWGLYLIEQLRGGLNSSLLSSVTAILFSAIAGSFLAELFQIKNKLTSMMIATSITCSPMISMFLTYPYCADAYAISFLLGILAVYAVIKTPNKTIGIILGILFTTFSTGIYQTGLGVMLATSIGYLLLNLLRNPDQLNSVLKDSLRLFITVIIGTLLYYGIVQLSLIIWNTELSSYKGADSVGLGNIIQNILVGIQSAYQNFEVFFLDNWIARNSYGENYLYIAIIILTILSILTKLKQLLKYPLVILSILICIIVFPLCANVITIVIPGTAIYLLMASGMMITIPLLIAIINQDNSFNTELLFQKIHTLLNKGAIILLGLLIWAYALSSNTDSLVMLNNKNLTLQLANRVWYQIESNQNYVPFETTILIAGTPDQGNYPNPSALTEKANDYASSYGMIWNTYEGSSNTWLRFYRLYLGIDYIMCSPEQFKEIAQTTTFKEMPLYPAEESIQVINGILVVKISEVTDWE